MNDSFQPTSHKNLRVALGIVCDLHGSFIEFKLKFQLLYLSFSKYLIEILHIDFSINEKIYNKYIMKFSQKSYGNPQTTITFKLTCTLWF